MDVQDPNEETQRVLIKHEQFSEEEKREAFKKKLRKYSGKSKNEDFEQLPWTMILHFIFSHNNSIQHPSTLPFTPVNSQ